MSKNQMGEDPMKCVLQYMDANLRFQLASRCPSLTKIEKSVPLKIDYLCFGCNYIQINKVKYTIRVHKEYHVPGTPEAMQFEFAEKDYDKYGFEYCSLKTTVTPGDICLQTGYLEYGPDRMNYMMPLLDRLQGEWDRRQDGRPVEPGAWNSRMDKRSDASIEDTLVHQQNTLLPYYYKKANVRPPCEMFLELKIGENQIHRSPYNTRLCDVMKRLGNIFFEGRGLIYTNWFRAFSDIIRLPIGAKFKTRKLQFQVHIETALTALAPILDPSSFPLDVIKMGTGSFAYTNPQDYNHLTVLEAREQWITRLAPPPSYPILVNFMHPRVHFVFEVYDEKYKMFTFSQLIDNWIFVKRPVKHHFSFEYLDVERAKFAFEEVKKHYGLITDESFINLPIPDTDTRLCVSYNQSTYNPKCGYFHMKVCSTVPPQPENDDWEMVDF